MSASLELGFDGECAGKFKLYVRLRLPGTQSRQSRQTISCEVVECPLFRCGGTRQGKSFSARLDLGSFCLLSLSFGFAPSKAILQLLSLMSGLLDVPQVHHPFPMSNCPAKFSRLRFESLPTPACFASPFATMASRTVSTPFAGSTPSSSEWSRAVTRDYSPP